MSLDDGQVVDLMNRTQWMIGEWCAHLTQEEMGTLRAGGQVSFWAFSDLDEGRGGVSTCIISAGVRATGEQLAPDLQLWENMRPVELRVSGQ